jgi:glutathione synthase/RimK-type ligase-like ATP-grasp enzyme
MTKRDRIVIVTDKFDPHTDMVMVELRNMGHQPVRLHPADFPMSASVTLTLDQEHWNGTLDTHKGALHLDEIKSVWWRRPEPHVVASDLPRAERIFARQETEHTFSGMWSILDCYWMSFPLHIRRASNKIEQLQRAARLGFHVPRTLITNDPEQVKAFYDTCNGHIIYKTLVAPMPDWAVKEPGPVGGEGADVQMIYTTRINQEHFEFLETVGTAACQFQELIPKRLELRVTIIGDDMFVCEIHSQEDERTSLDWRHYEASIPYTKGSLPPDIAEKCFALMKSYGLNYSAMDLILTPEGEYIFLENNPSGQCFFIQEHIPEFKMVEAVASYLLRGNA